MSKEEVIDDVIACGKEFHQLATEIKAILKQDMPKDLESVIVSMGKMFVNLDGVVNELKTHSEEELKARLTLSNMRLKGIKEIHDILKSAEAIDVMAPFVFCRM